MDQNQNIEFPMAEAKRIVQDLFEPKPWIYWIDFLFSALLGWSCFVLAINLSAFSFFQIAAWCISSLALYRSVIFVHELTHLKKGTFQTFHMALEYILRFSLNGSFHALYGGAH